MKGRIKLAIGVAVIAAATAATTVAVAGGGDDIRENLTGYEETPVALSTTGDGSFKARINERQQRIDYRLRYEALEGSVTQAHIHLGTRAQTGGIIVFLCTNQNNGPAGTQPCPPAPASVSGTLTPADVIGPAGQGITAGQFQELIDAIRHGATYANVHSTLYPGGEIRAQLEDDGDRGHDDD
jgi:CHRD domain